MKLTGRCYCGELHYEAEGEPVMQAECLCRECQYISGGGPNFFILMPEDGFRFTKGTAKQFARSDLDTPRTRDFCGNCGTHIITRLPGRPLVVVKVGTLDDPAVFEGPQAAIYAIDRQPFHAIADGVPVFERLPG